MRRSILADSALVLVALVWGLNFVITKEALTKITPFMYLGIRFILAFLILIVIFHKNFAKMTKNDLKGGLGVGLVIFLGFITQTIGLKYTTPSKSGFITGIYVVLVPFLAYFFTGQFPKITQILSAIITFIGLGMVSIDESFTVNFGDVLTLAGALFFAMQIVLTEHFVKRADPINITIIQTALTGILSLALGLFMEPMPQLIEKDVVYAIIFAAVVCTAGAFTVQNIAQKHTDSTHAAILLCMESVSSGFFSFLLWNEVFTLRMLIGFGLILFGVIASELLPQTEKSKISTKLNEIGY